MSNELGRRGWLVTSAVLALLAGCSSSAPGKSDGGGDKGGAGGSAAGTSGGGSGGAGTAGGSAAGNGPADAAIADGGDAASNDAPATSDTSGSDADAPSGTDGGADADAAPAPVAPVVIATGFDVGSAITSDGTSVFFLATNWHDDGGLTQETRLVQVPVAGGAMTTRFAYSSGNLQGGTGAVEGGITVDGANLFFCGSAHAWRMPIASGNAVDLMPGSSPPTGFFGCEINPLVDATNVYSGNGSNDYTIFSVAKTGGTPSYFAGTTIAAYTSAAMVTDGTYVYWVPASGAFVNTLQRALGSGGAPETFVPLPAADAGITSYVTLTETILYGAGWLYWIDGQADKVWGVPTTGGVPTALHDVPRYQGGLASDGVSLYWTEALNGIYSIQKMPVQGGAATTVVDAITISANVTENPPRFAVDGANVYWLGPPNVYKAPK